MIRVKYGLLVSVPFIAGVVTRGLMWWQQLILAILCVSVVAWAIVQTIKADKLAQQKEHKDHSQRPLPNIYIGPSGIPVSFVAAKIRVDLKFFSCTTVRLLHIKVYVGSPPHTVTLSDSEPDEIKAGEVFMKALEQPIDNSLRQLLILKPQILLVQGIAKFSDNVEHKFVFQTRPLL